MSGRTDDLLRASPAAVREVQEARLREIVSLCWSGHPYYRARWAAGGLSAESVQGLDDLPRLPLTTKDDLAADPEAFRLVRGDAPSFESALWDVVYTTGTTRGRPTPIYNTPHDFYVALEAYRRMNGIRGIGADDVVANLLPLGPLPHGAFLRYTMAPLTVGARTVVPLVGPRTEPFPVHRSLDDAVALIARHRATVLIGVPSFLRRFLLRMAEVGEEGGAIRLLATTGEPVPADLRSDLRALAAAVGASVQISASYGASEIQFGFVECGEEAGMHHPAPEFFYLEIVDPDGRRLPDGEPGLVAVTHLYRRGTVLIRYLLGDRAVMTHAPCPRCGRTSERILGVPSRVDRLLKVRGMLVNPDTLVEAVRRVRGIDEFQVRLLRADPADAHSMDVVEIAVATAGANRPWIEAQVIASVREAVRVTPRVVFVDPAALYSPEATMKANRLVDLRDGEDRR